MQRQFMRATVIFSIVVVMILGLATFSFPYAPLEDLPEWIYQGYIFNELVSGTPSPDFALKNFPVPYALFQTIASACLLFASPMAASRIVVFLYAGLSLYAINRVIARYRLDPYVAWPLLISAVVLNSPFWNGYMGYQFGLIVILLYLALPERLQVDAKWICLFSVLGFFAHGWPFISILTLIGCNALFRRRILAACLGVAPSIALLAWYQVRNVNPGTLSEFLHVEHVNIFAYKIYTVLKAAPFHNPIVFSFNASERYGIAFVGAGLLIDAVFLIALAVLAVLAIGKSGPIAILRRPQLLAGGLLLLLAAALPPTGFGMANPGERVMYPAIIALLIAIFTDVELAIIPKAILGCALAAGVGLFALGLVGASAAYRAEAASFDPNAAPPPEISRNLLFGHRLVQFDEKMRLLERAWRDGVMPTTPLAFETALIAPRGR
jgi:hypothetical protein